MNVYLFHYFDSHIYPIFPSFACIGKQNLLESLVLLASALKDAQVEEKHCYQCNSPEHFIHDCPLVRASRENIQLNCKEGIASIKGTWTPQMKMTMPKNPQEEVPKV